MDHMLDKFSKKELFINDEILVMSTFLMHKTMRNKKINPKFWRLGISIRVDDFSDVFWKNNYYCSYEFSR